ncbi:uncharacterized protein [Argopecten irradians]
MATASIPVRTEGQTTCNHHKGRQLDMYCEKCQELICLKCIATIHKTHPMCELSEVASQKKQDIRNFIDRTEQNDLVHQMQKCKTVLQQGSQIEINDIKCEIDSQIHIPGKAVLGTVSFNPNNTPKGQLVQALGKATTSSQGHTSTDQKRLVLLSDGQQQPSSQQQSEDKDKKAVDRKTLLTETKVVEEWKSPCDIYSICPTTDDQAWTKYSETLTLLDRKGTVIQKVTHKASIMDISLSPTTHRLWVCDTQSNILELVSGQLTQQFTTKARPICICITAKNHVIVGMLGNVSKYTTQGQMVLTTMAAGTGKPLVCTPYRITACPVTNNVAVIDHSNIRDGGDGNRHVFVMDTDFQQLFVYRGDIPSTNKQSPQTGGKPFNPYGLVYDKQGSLIIGDYNTKNVVILSENGKGHRILHTDRNWVWGVGVGRDDLLWISTVRKACNVKMLQYYKM